MFQIIGSHSGHQVCISLFGGPGAASTSKNRTLFSALGPKRGIEVVFKPQARILWEYYASRRFFHGGSLQLVKTIFFSQQKNTGTGFLFDISGITPVVQWSGPQKAQSPLQNTKTIGERRRGAQFNSVSRVVGSKLDHWNKKSLGDLRGITWTFSLQNPSYFTESLPSRNFLGESNIKAYSSHWVWWKEGGWMGIDNGA